MIRLLKRQVVVGFGFVMSSPVDIFWLKIWWIVMLLSSATRRAVSNTSRLFGEMSVEG